MTEFARDHTEVPGQYLSFRLDDEEYAVAILRVKEILRYEPVTRVPTTPAFIRGVINIRGRMVPIIDLAVKLGLSPRQVTKWTCMVVVEVRLDDEDTIMGLMVDAVQQVLELSPGEIEEPPAFGPQIHVDYLLGMGKAGQKFVMLLDIDRVLATNELVHIAALGDADVDESHTAQARDGEPDAWSSPHEPVAPTDDAQPDSDGSGADESP